MGLCWVNIKDTWSYGTLFIMLFFHLKGGTRSGNKQLQMNRRVLPRPDKMTTWSSLDPPKEWNAERMSARALLADCLELQEWKMGKTTLQWQRYTDILTRQSSERFLAPLPVFLVAFKYQFRDHMIPRASSQVAHCIELDEKRAKKSNFILYINKMSYNWWLSKDTQLTMLINKYITCIENISVTFLTYTIAWTFIHSF